MSESKDLELKWNENDIGKWIICSGNKNDADKWLRIESLIDDTDIEYTVSKDNSYHISKLWSTKYTTITTSAKVPNDGYFLCSIAHIYKNTDESVILNVKIATRIAIVKSSITFRFLKALLDFGLLSSKYNEVPIFRNSIHCIYNKSEFYMKYVYSNINNLSDADSTIDHISNIINKMIINRVVSLVDMYITVESHGEIDKFIYEIVCDEEKATTLMSKCPNFFKWAIVDTIDSDGYVNPIYINRLINDKLNEVYPEVDDIRRYTYTSEDLFSILD